MDAHGKSTAAARSLLLCEARSLHQDALQDAEERRSLPWRVMLHLFVAIALAGLRFADFFVSDANDDRVASGYSPAAALAEAVALLCVGFASFAWSVHRGRQIQFEMSSRIDRAIAQYEESVTPRRSRAGRGARQSQQPRPRPRMDSSWQHSVRSLLDERLPVPVTSVSVVPTYRDGVWRSTPGNLLVQHDVIALMEGDIAPADAQCLDSDDSNDRVCRGQEVRVPESSGAGTGAGSGAAPSASAPGADARDISTLRLARRMRRFLVLATPLRAHLRHLLDPRQRPRPLMQDHRRRVEHVAAAVAVAAALVATTAIVVRAAARGDMSWGGALVTRLSTVLLLASGAWYPALHALCEAIGTGLLLAKVEAATRDFRAGQQQETGAGGDMRPAANSSSSGGGGVDPPLARQVSNSALSGEGEGEPAEDEEAGEMGQSTGTVAPPASLRRILYYTMRTIRGSTGRSRQPRQWDPAAWLWAAWRAAEGAVAGSHTHPPLPPVLREFRLLERLGGVTVACAVDSEVVLEREPVVEEVFLLDRKKSGLTLDLYRTSTAPFGVNFETRDWRRLLPLLKPLGLSCLAHAHAGFSAPFMDEEASPSPQPQWRDSPGRGRSAEAAPGDETSGVGGSGAVSAGLEGLEGLEEGRRRSSAHSTAESSSAAARSIRALAHYVKRQPPASSAVYALARTMGFVDVDLSGFQLCRRLHVTAPRLIQPFVSSRRVTPPPPRMVTHLTGLVVEDTRTRSLQLLSRGHPGLVLERCSAYWDGRTVRPLTDVSRRLVADMYSQLRQENFTCEAFAYRPIADAERHLFPAQGEIFHRPNAYLVEDALEVEEAEEQQQEQQRAAAAALLAAHRAEEGEAGAGAAGGGGMGEERATGSGQADQAGARQEGEGEGSNVPGSQAGVGGSTSSDRSEGGEGGDEGAARSAQTRTALQIDGGSSALAGQQSMLDPVQRNQVFVGMTATREQPNSSIQRLVDTLTTAGVRFAYFSPCTYRLTKPLANSMGLETGWNCAISLREWEDEIAKMLEGWDLKARLPHGIDAIRRHLAEVDNVPLLVSLYTDATPNACRDMISIMQENGESVAAVGSSLFAPNGDVMAQADLAIAVSSLGEEVEAGQSAGGGDDDDDEEEEEEEEGYGYGEEDFAREAAQPGTRGDAPPDRRGEEEVARDTHGAGTGTGAGAGSSTSPRLHRAVSAGVALDAVPAPLGNEGEADPALRPAVSVGPGAGAGMEEEEEASGMPPHALSAPTLTTGGISTPSPRRAVRGARGHVSAADLRFSERLTTLPCALTLPRAASLLPLTAVLREGRRALANFRQALLFAAYAHGVLLAAETIAAGLSLPVLLSPGAVLWLSWVAVPALCTGIALQPAEEGTMSSRRVPLKLPPHSNPPAVGRHMGYLAARAALPVATLLLVHAWVLSSSGIAAEAMVWGQTHSLRWAGGRGLSAVADAQAATLLAAAFVLATASAGFLQRNQSLRDEPPRNALWIAAVATILCAHLLEAGLLRALRGNSSLLAAGLSPWLWPAMAVFAPCCILAVDEAVKRHDRRLFTREMHGLRLIFDTRLGMHSPQ